jgi:hypothetical protein
VEEQPRKLEHVIKILNICLEKTDVTREMYADQAQELVLNENILLQTLGFDVAIDHPHTHVVKACQLFNIVTGRLNLPFAHFQESIYESSLSLSRSNSF